MDDEQVVVFSVFFRSLWREGGLSYTGTNFSPKYEREREIHTHNYLNPWNQSLWTSKQWITKLRWGMEQSFAVLFCPLWTCCCDVEVKTHEHTHAVPVRWCFDWLLDFKVGEPAAGTGGATWTRPGGLLQDWSHRDQGAGAWSRPTVCLSHSSTEQKERVTALDTYAFYAWSFSLC